MKSFISLFLIFAHLFSTVGFSMGVHECGESKSYSIYGFSLNKQCQCDHESIDHDKDCCEDKQNIVKGEDKDKIGNKIFISKKIAFEYDGQHLLPPAMDMPVFTNPDLLIYRTEFPPGNAPPLYILYKDFLI